MFAFCSARAQRYSPLAPFTWGRTAKRTRPQTSERFARPKSRFLNRRYLLMDHVPDNVPAAAQQNHCTANPKYGDNNSWHVNLL